MRLSDELYQKYEIATFESKLKSLNEGIKQLGKLNIGIIQMQSQYYIYILYHLKNILFYFKFVKYLTMAQIKEGLLIVLI